MPTYEYECLSCAHSFEAFQGMNDAPLDECPVCGKAVRRRINGGMGVIFKGSGFYKNDARSSAPSKGSSPKESAPKADPAPASCCAGCSAGACPAGQS